MTHLQFAFHSRAVVERALSGPPLVPRPTQVSLSSRQTRLRGACAPCWQHHPLSKESRSAPTSRSLR